MFIFTLSFCSQSCPTLFNFMDCSTPSLSPTACTNSCPLSRWSHTVSFSVIPFSSCLQSFPASGSFLMSRLHIRWPKYCIFSFIINPSNEYSGLISFKVDWFDLLAVQGTLKSLLLHHCSKASVLQCSAFFMVQLSHSYSALSLAQQIIIKLHANSSRVHEGRGECVCRWTAWKILSRKQYVR